MACPATGIGHVGGQNVTNSQRRLRPAPVGVSRIRGLQDKMCGLLTVSMLFFVGARAGRVLLDASDGSSGFAAQMSAYYQDGNFLKTQFTGSVDPANPLPEHPKPQFQRPNSWQSLNGVWEVENTTSSTPPFGQTLQQQIVVPFPVESAMSGVQAHTSRLTYRRLFSPSLNNSGDHVILHVERVDYSATVYVNQQLVGTHYGGFDSFDFDITQQLSSSGQNELIILVEDDTELAMQPIGKQRSIVTNAILYTSVTGIWGSVWLETVPAAYITAVEFYPDVDYGQVHVTVHGSPAAKGMQATVAIFEGSTHQWGASVITNVVPLETETSISIDNVKLWSPSNPFLYNVTITLSSPANSSQVLTTSVDLSPLYNQSTANVQVDEVLTYFGMRKIAIQKDSNSVPRIALNNEFIFQWGMLDQGYTPDGIYTYPSDEAMLFDLNFQKSAGANMVRKHQKVEPDRWYYHCDTLGLLVWQDMPAMCGCQYPNGNNPNPNDNASPNGWDIGIGGNPCWVDSRVIDDNAQQQWRTELSEIVSEHIFSPSVIYYSIFNEAWGQFDTPGMTQFAQSLDPTLSSGRNQFLISSASGWVQFPTGDMVDNHDYTLPVPVVVPNVTGSSRAGAFGEYGGLKWRVDGHNWQYNLPGGGDPYTGNVMDNTTILQQTMVEQTLALGSYLDTLSAAVLTQVTDTELELNGLLTYDRAVNKVPDFSTFTSLVQQLIANSSRYTISG